MHDEEVMEAVVQLLNKPIMHVALSENSCRWIQFQCCFHVEYKSALRKRKTRSVTDTVAWLFLVTTRKLFIRV